MKTRSAVRRLVDDDVAHIAPVLAQAFSDDPFGGWLFVDASERVLRLERYFAFYLSQVALTTDWCLAAAGLEGAALWKPPGSWKLSPLAGMRLFPTLARLLGKRLPTILRGAAALEKVHPREPHAYLPFIGVAPDHQNRGIGSSLLQPVLERCDRERIGAYLEASSEENVRLYGRHGFEVKGELHLPGGLTAWPMWRSAR